LSDSIIWQHTFPRCDFQAANFKTRGFIKLVAEAGSQRLLDV